ncbi:MAG: pyridoxamine 5'-phosphate oxidase family protein [Anaerolineales bacterium]|nr:pyridoxamine 5'-phosphate oxidase family protein [Anaerolineales bacterium]
MQLTDNQRKFLSKVHFAVVSTIASDGMPHQTVMWYMLNGNQILLSTPRESLKHKHLKRDNRISICVEKGYMYVTITGKVMLNEEPIQAKKDYDVLGKRYRGTFNPFMILGFMFRGLINSIQQKINKDNSPQPDTNRMQDLLTRERVTLNVEIEKIHSNSLD